MTMRCGACAAAIVSPQHRERERQREREQFQSFQLDQLSLHIYIYKLYREREASPSLLTVFSSPAFVQNDDVCVYIEKKSLFKVLKKERRKFLSFYRQTPLVLSLARIIVHQLSLYNTHKHTYIYLYTIIQYILYVGYIERLGV